MGASVSTMTTAVLLNDTHFVSKNPVSRTDDFNAELFTALDQVAKIARHVKADVVLHAGDWFHKAGRVPWSTLVQLLTWAAQLRRDGTRIYTIPGNHDLEHDRYDSLNGLPIGALFESGLFVNVSRRGLYIGEGPTAVYGVPWPDGAEALAPGVVPGYASIVLLHGFATPEGQPRYGQFCHAYDKLAAAAPHVRLWHFGHDHSDHGVYTAKNGAKMVNIGAIARGALDTDNLTRQVKVAIAKIPTGDAPVEVQQVALKLKPVEEVFDLQLRARKRQEQAEIEQFVAQLSGNLNTLLSVDYHTILDGLGLDAAVKRKVEEYIERAETV